MLKWLKILKHTGPNSKSFEKADTDPEQTWFRIQKPYLCPFSRLHRTSQRRPVLYWRKDFLENVSQHIYLY
jgi:hypothetical protein